MEATTIHAMLTREAEKQQLPKAYHRDLTVHDLDQLVESGSQRFIWVLRTCGTFLMPLDTPAHRRTARTMVEGCRHFADDQMLWYIFENENLVCIDADEARRLAQES